MPLNLNQGVIDLFIIIVVFSLYVGFLEYNREDKKGK